MSHYTGEHFITTPGYCSKEDQGSICLKYILICTTNYTPFQNDQIKLLEIIQLQIGDE